MQPKITNDHKVSLTEKGTGTMVEFEVLPEMTETHNVGYEAVAPAQFVGAFQKFKGRESTTWNVSVMLIARNTAEASANYFTLLTLKGWTMPYFGAQTAVDYSSKLGAPPPVLLLKGLRNLIGPVPVVITAMPIAWPRDVDYIPTNVKGSDGNYIPFPVVMNVPISMTESYSIDQFNNFSLADYRTGHLELAFASPPAAAKTSVPSQTVEAADSNELSRFAAAKDNINQTSEGGRSDLDRFAQAKANISSGGPDGAVQLPLRLAADTRKAQTISLSAAVASAKSFLSNSGPR